MSGGPSRGGEEAFEQQSERDRVDVGDAERVADRGRGGRAPALAEDVRAPAERHDVPDGEEVAREPEFPDDPEFVVEPGPCSLHPLGTARPVALGRAASGELDQEALLGAPVGDREVGEARRDQTQVERASRGDRPRGVDRSGPPGEPPALLGLSAETGGARRGEPPLELLEGLAGADRGQSGGEGEPVGRGVVHVVGRHRRDPAFGGEQGQRVVPGGVDGVPVVPELDREVLASEAVDQLIERARCDGRPAGGERGGERPLAAPGEDLPVAAVPVRQLVEGDDRSSLLATGQVGRREDLAEARVALGVPGEDHEMGATRIGHAGADLRRGAGAGDGELGAEHGGQAQGAGGLGEADHAVEPVVIGQGESGETEPDRLRGQLLGMTRTVEEGEVGVCVELGVGHRRVLIRRSLRPTSAPVRRAAGGRPCR